MTKNKKIQKVTKHTKQKQNCVLSKKGISSNWINFMKNEKKDVTFKIKPATNTEKPLPKKCRSKKEPKVVAIDCEMVSDENGVDMLARVSIVDFQFNCIYDKYVKPTSSVGDYRTRFSGIREGDIENGQEFDVVQQEVRDILRNKILVGHSLRNDLNALKFGHHFRLIRDTSLYKPFRDEASAGKTPALRKLAQQYLDEIIQQGEHSSVQDATAAMKLYKKFRHEWEKSLMGGANKKEIKKSVVEDVSNS